MEMDFVQNLAVQSRRGSELSKYFRSRQFLPRKVISPVYCLVPQCYPFCLRSLRCPSAIITNPLIFCCILITERAMFYRLLYRSKLLRDKDRDISEKIALGMPSNSGTQESMYDQRLFNKSQVCH